jgi:hypothetical protein
VAVNRGSEALVKHARVIIEKTNGITIIFKVYVIHTVHFLIVHISTNKVQYYNAIKHISHCLRFIYVLLYFN